MKLRLLREKGIKSIRVEEDETKRKEENVESGRDKRKEWDGHGNKEWVMWKNERK